MRNRHLLFVCTVLFISSSCKKMVDEPSDKSSPAYTTQAAVSYSESNILRVPGNYQGWNVSAAPKLVSWQGNGEYEGFINLSNEQNEFWLVRGTAWDNVTTYNQTGENSFGHNGTYFTLPKGIYRINANTKNFTWSSTRIYSWSIKGTAIAANGEMDMQFDALTGTWRITGDFSKGGFIFRANKENDIVFGHNSETKAGVAEYNGEPILLTAPGNYTIVLSLFNAGNYGFVIQKNRN